MIIPNKYNCPPNIWNSFTQEGKLRFNDVLNKTATKQKELIHPEALPMPDKHWLQICFHMACISGWGLKEYEFTKAETAFSDTYKLMKLGFSNQ